MASSNVGDTSLNYAVPSDGGGLYYVRVWDRDSTRGLLSQYLLSVDLADTIAPEITSTSLPELGSTSAAVWTDHIRLFGGFDRIAQRRSNLDLRTSGNDGLFDTQDDVVYQLTHTDYSSGLETTYFISDGPLQAAEYWFTASTGLTDRVGNPLSESFVQSFTVEDVPGFILEDRSNNSQSLATSLSLEPSDVTDGTFLGSVAEGLGETRTTLPVVTSMRMAILTWRRPITAHTTSVVFGQGDGWLQPEVVSITVGTNPIAVAVDLNGDGHQDLAVANYSSNNVSILEGQGDGTFVASDTVSVGAQPYQVIAKDLNRDGSWTW